MIEDVSELERWIDEASLVKLEQALNFEDRLKVCVCA